MHSQVIVSGLPKDSNDDSIREIFKLCKIDSISYVGNRDDLRQTAIITFSQEDDARTAVANYDKYTIDDIPLSVSLYQADNIQGFPNNILQNIGQQDQNSFINFQEKQSGNQDKMKLPQFSNQNQQILQIPQMRMPPQNQPQEIQHQFMQQNQGIPGHMPPMQPFPLPMFNQPFPPPPMPGIPIPIPPPQIAMVNQQNFPNNQYEPQKYDELVKLLRIYKEELLVRGTRVMNAMN